MAARTGSADRQRPARRPTAAAAAAAGHTNTRDPVATPVDGPGAEADGTTLAALDLGTNSFHLVVARLRGSTYEVVTREKQTIRLGHGGGDMKELTPEAIDRGIASLRRMRRLADSHGAPVRAVATSAVREAENASTFITRARDEAGIDVEVISGLEEARLIHLGVLQAVPVFERRLILVDIGGGSTEILVGERGATLAARSFKLGAVRLTDRFFPDGIATPKKVAACRSYVRSMLAGFEREVHEHGFDVAIASSGTAETIAHMVHARRGGVLPRTFNCYEFTRAELDEVVAALVAKRTPQARMAAVPGLEAQRSDIIVAGALVLQAVAETFGIATFTFSEAALREGVLLDTIARVAGGDLHHLADVSRQSIRALAARCDHDVVHSQHVADLALQIYDGTEELHGLPSHCRDYLEAAALLANVGLVISHSKHHLHSYYVIRNSDLAGLTDNEIEIIALVARYHRKSSPKQTHPEFVHLDPGDQVIVRTLAAILRVAIALDRSHDGRIQGLRVERRGRRLTLEVIAESGRDVSLEVYTAHERSALLEDVLAVRLDVVPVAS